MDIADDDIDIDKRVKDLLERGLDRYGEGDLEGALAHWKHALILDPENEKATQYASYVGDNHDLADADEDIDTQHGVELDYPFGIEELGLAKLSDDQLENDYESIVIESDKKRKLAKSAAKESKASSAAIDDGWDVDEGWVAELVEQTDTAFAGSSEGIDPAAVKVTFKTAAKIVPPKTASVDRAKRITAKVELPKNEQIVAAAFAETSPGVPASSGLDDAISDFRPDSHSKTSVTIGTSFPQEFDLDDDHKEEGDDDYAAIEVGLASGAGGIDLDFSDASEAQTVDNSEADFGSLNADEESDFGDLNLDTSSGGQDLLEEPMELRPSDAKAPNAPIKPIAAIERSIADLDLGDVAIGGPSLAAAAAAPVDQELLADQTDDEALAQIELDALAQIERDAPQGDSSQRTTYIVGRLLERGLSQRDTGNVASASFAVGRALERADDCAAAQKLIYAQEDDLVSVLMAGLGEASRVPELIVPLTDIPRDEIDNRAAFLLTRVDGSLSLEEILIVCGMPKLEALRHLSRMQSRSYLSVG